MQSSKNLERKFLSTENSFQTYVTAHPSFVPRFSKILEMYAPIVYQNEHGTTVYEWNVSNPTELKTVAKMYYGRYNILSR